MLGAGALGRPRGMEWGGRRVQDGEHMYTCGGFILIFGKTNTVMVKFKNKIKLKKINKNKKVSECEKKKRINLNFQDKILDNFNLPLQACHL